MEFKAKEINIIKTLMMLSVVLYHSCIFFTKNWFPYTEAVFQAEYLKPVVFFLNTFHVQGFMACSGFLFYLLKERGKYDNKREFALKKFKRLIIPLYITLLLWVIPFHIMFYGFDFKDICKQYILLYSPRQLWFLPCLFFISCFFEVFYDKIKYTKMHLVILAVLTTGISAILSHFGLMYFQLANTVKFLLYFYLGGYIYFNKEEIIEKNNVKKYYIIAIFMTLIITYVLNISKLKMLNYIATMMAPFISCLEVIGIYSLCYNLSKNDRILNSKLFGILNNNSFGIYLFHQQIIYVIIVLLNGIVHPLIQCLVCFLVSVLMSLIISMLLKKSSKTKSLFGLY